MSKLQNNETELMSNEDFKSLMVEFGFGIADKKATNENDHHYFNLFKNATNFIEKNPAEYMISYFIKKDIILIISRTDFNLTEFGCCHVLFGNSVKSIQVKKELFYTPILVNVSHPGFKAIRTSLLFSCVCDFRIMQDYLISNPIDLLKIEDDYIRLDSLLMPANSTKVPHLDTIFTGLAHGLTLEEFKLSFKKSRKLINNEYYE